MESAPEPFVVDTDAELTEGPVWDGPRGRLLWVDITAGRVHSIDIETARRELWQLDHEVGAVAPCAGGGLVIADRMGFARLDEKPTRLSDVVEPGLRMNDGACDPTGCFWAGTMAFDERPGAGALYRLSTDGSVQEMLGGVTISNGIGWSRDGARMYYVDSGVQSVEVFDWQPGAALGRRRRLVVLPAAAGTPDGLAVDAEDCLWVAFWGGWAVRRYSPEGELLSEVGLPVARVTSCAFGGEKLDELFITTAAHGLSEQERREQPLAGAIFRCRPGVRGLETFAYAG